MRNVAEACTAANRSHVHESVAGSSHSGSRAHGSHGVGAGQEPDVDVGPLIDRENSSRRSRSWSPTAPLAEHRVLIGGKPWMPLGYFYEPTVTSTCRRRQLLREEIFGPLPPTPPSRSEPGRLAGGHRTDTGSVSYVYNPATESCDRVSEGIESGMVVSTRESFEPAAAVLKGVNTPDSARGRSRASASISRPILGAGGLTSVGG